MLKQLQLRRRSEQTVLPQIRAIDLNDLGDVQATLESISEGDKSGQWHTIFVCEAVLAYLDMEVLQ